MLHCSCHGARESDPNDAVWHGCTTRRSIPWQPGLGPRPSGRARPDGQLAVVPAEDSGDVPSPPVDGVRPSELVRLCGIRSM